MDQLRFGTAGIPLSTPERNILNGIKYLKTLGLSAMEVEFVRSVHITSEKAPEVKRVAQQEDVALTCHGQYYVNLNAQDQKVLQQSMQRILTAARVAQQCGVWSLCYHFGYYMGQPQEKAYEQIKTAVKNIIHQFQEEGISLWLRPETGGKLTQFGDLPELIQLSQEVEQVLPCIDWAHHHARSNGKFNTVKEFSHILEQIEKGLGRSALDNMHMHIEGIEYTEKGERNHVNLEESDFNYQDLLKTLKEFRVKGVAICESPNIEEDAVKMQKFYQLKL